MCFAFGELNIVIRFHNPPPPPQKIDGFSMLAGGYPPLTSHQAPGIQPPSDQPPKRLVAGCSWLLVVGGWWLVASFLLMKSL